MWIPEKNDRKTMEKMAKVMGIKVGGKTDDELLLEITKWMTVRVRAWGELGAYGQN